MPEQELPRDKRLPSEAYREQTMRKLLDDPDVRREIKEFSEFVAGERKNESAD